MVGIAMHRPMASLGDDDRLPGLNRILAAIDLHHPRAVNADEQHIHLGVDVATDSLTGRYRR